jgi:hypothetical protein
VNASQYTFGIIKAVVPPLLPWTARVLTQARITQPEDNDVVTVGAVKVSGTYRFDCGLSFVLLHQYGHEYWPQGTPVLDRTRRRWQKDVYICPPLAEKHLISSAAITEDIRPLFNYYYEVGKSTKQWHPIPLYQLPNGIAILHTIRVQPRAA